MLVLEPRGDSFRIVTNTTITNLPICVMDTTSHGWHDLSVWVRQGGVEPGYQVRLRFDGKAYPTNPSVHPAQKLGGDEIGKIVIPDDPSAAKPLYSESENPDPL